MKWICDPGHAWLKVPLKALFKSGVANQISSYSYLRGHHAYLEEDSDAGKYLLAIGYYNTPATKEIALSHTNKRSKIRSYKSYSCFEAELNLIGTL